MSTVLIYRTALRTQQRMTGMITGELGARTQTHAQTLHCRALKRRVRLCRRCVGAAALASYAVRLMARFFSVSLSRRDVCRVSWFPHSIYFYVNICMVAVIRLTRGDYM